MSLDLLALMPDLFLDVSGDISGEKEKGTGKLYLTSPPPLFMMREPIKYYNGDTKYASYCQDDHKG